MRERERERWKQLKILIIGKRLRSPIDVTISQHSRNGSRKLPVYKAKRRREKGYERPRGRNVSQKHRETWFNQVLRIFDGGFHAHNTTNERCCVPAYTYVCTYVYVGGGHDILDRSGGKLR